MNATETLKTTSTTSGKAATGRLFYLEASGGRIHSANADGSDRKVIVSGARVPDGVVVDVEAGHIYWTNMGVPNKNDGSIERVDLDGKNRVTISGEGMSVMRANLDGSSIETLIDTSKGDPRPGTDQTKWCVGITVDPDRGQIYWTQKGPDDAGKGRLFRAKIDISNGETAANRTDIEVLFDGLPEPIDLEVDLKNRVIYWTDRGDPPRGNTVNRASLDADFSTHPASDILLTHLMEGIGIALDFKGNRMFKIGRA